MSRVWGTFWEDPDQMREFRFTRRQFARAWHFAQPYRGALLVYLATSIANAIFAILPALAIKRLIDQALPSRDLAQLTWLAAGLAGLYIANTALNLGAAYLGERIALGIILNLRLSLFDHLQRMPLAFFTRTQTGMLQSRLNNDVGEVNSFFTQTASSTITDVLSIAFTLVAMVALSPLVTLFVCLLIPVLLVPAEFVARRSRRLNREQMKRWGAMNATTAERFNVSGALLVKLFGRYERELRSFAEKVTQIRNTAIQTEMLSVLFGSSLGLAGSLAVVAIYLVGGRSVIAGTLTLGTIVALATLAQRVYAPAVDLAHTRIQLAAGMVAFERVFEVLDTPQLIRDRRGAVALSEPRGEVAFEDVWFRYPAPATYSIASLEAEKPGEEGKDGHLPAEPSDWILRGVSLRATPGTMTALVGHTGAGKTTLCNLVPRLYEATRGRVLMDGRDVRDLTLESLSAAVGMVPQDPHLFHDTVIANLRYARPDATDEEVFAACRAARIHELIASLPDGYETMAGDRGYRFSGGEKQRLAIARLILKAPAVMILDEATSHLDSETETLVKEALAAAFRGRTSFVIAHRLSTIRAADQILVVHEGRIAERGRHEELLARGGIYAELYETQFAIIG
ncbi:MAG TPA: ABC transporter ATP-binding protein [Candidatus Dormibacteraeota bacterium]